MEQQQRRGENFAAAAKQKSYQLAPRATIFRRDAGSVTGLASLKRLMRSNSFRTDPVCSACLPALSLHLHNARMKSRVLEYSCAVPCSVHTQSGLLEWLSVVTELLPDLYQCSIWALAVLPSGQRIGRFRCAA